MGRSLYGRQVGATLGQVDYSSISGWHPHPAVSCLLSFFSTLFSPSFQYFLFPFLPPLSIRQPSSLIRRFVPHHHNLRPLTRP